MLIAEMMFYYFSYFDFQPFLICYSLPLTVKSSVFQSIVMCIRSPFEICFQKPMISFLWMRHWDSYWLKIIINIYISKPHNLLKFKKSNVNAYRQNTNTYLYVKATTKWFLSQKLFYILKTTDPILFWYSNIHENFIWDRVTEDILKSIKRLVYYLFLNN